MKMVPPTLASERSLQGAPERMSRVDRLRRWLIIVDLCTLVLILVYLDACIPIVGI
jgi:hypothetical protein